MNAHRPVFVLMAAALIAFAASARVGASVIVESALTDADTSAPGARYEGSIRLRNTGREPAEVKLYQTDYAFTADGRNDYGEPGRLSRSNANWIVIDRNHLRVPAGGTADVGYRVRVPSGSGLRGSYWSMIMVEPIAKGSAESGEPLPERTTRLSQVTRYGVQVITDIGNGGAGALDFSNPRLLDPAEGHGQRLFAVDVENTGARWLRAKLWIELYSREGAPVGKFDGPLKRLFPGTSARFEVDLKDVPSGDYIALVAADGGGDNLFGANLELALP